jgi:transcription termination/antitermination protein NusG
MSFYVVSVQPRREERFIHAARQLPLAGVSGTGDVSYYWPRRKLMIRQKGRRKETLAAVFPGYIFLNAETVTDQIYRSLTKIPGFYRFLESNDHIRPLSGRDAEIVAHFVKFGEVIGKSTVTLDDNQRIKVLHGPLVGLEGMIVKVDKRKQRAKVRLDLYDESFLVDFGFELLAPDTRGQKAEKTDQ